MQDREENFIAKRICLNASDKVQIGGVVQRSDKKQDVDLYNPVFASKYSVVIHDVATSATPAAANMYSLSAPAPSGGIWVEQKDWLRRVRRYQWTLMGSNVNTAAASGHGITATIKAVFKNSGAADVTVSQSFAFALANVDQATGSTSAVMIKCGLVFLGLNGSALPQLQAYAKFSQNLNPVDSTNQHNATVVGPVFTSSVSGDCAIDVTLVQLLAADTLTLNYYDLRVV